jgi:dolichol-phosphate mannosyltransferase
MLSVVIPILLEWDGCRVMEFTVQHRPRRAGESKYSVLNRMFRAATDLLAMFWMRSRWLRYEIKR